MLEVLCLPLDPRQVFLDIAGVDDEHVVLLRQEIDQQIVNSTAIRLTQLCVQSLVEREARDIVRHKILQKRERVLSFDFKFAHMANIEKASTSTYDLMLVDNPTVLHGHLPATKIYQAGRERTMLLVERSTF